MMHLGYPLTNKVLVQLGQQAYGILTLDEIPAQPFKARLRRQTIADRRIKHREVGLGAKPAKFRTGKVGN